MILYLDTLLGYMQAQCMIYNTITKQLTEIDNEFTQQFEIENNTKIRKTIGVSPPFRLSEEGIRSPRGWWC